MIVEYNQPEDIWFKTYPNTNDIFVYDLCERQQSDILDINGRPLAYQKQSQDFIGFYRLGKR